VSTFRPLGRGLPSTFYKSKGREWIKRERKRDPLDRAASPLLRMGPAGPVDGDGGAPMLRPGAMCGVRPNGMGGAGLPGRRTGDVPCRDGRQELPGAFYGLTPGTVDGRGLP
jgi:hypothetical protein